MILIKYFQIISSYYLKFITEKHTKNNEILIKKNYNIVTLLIVVTIIIIKIKSWEFIF